MAIGFISLLAALPSRATADDARSPSGDRVLKAAVIMDHRAETALFGYDAVAYHTEGAARLGHAQYAVVRNGQVWRFASEANRAAFLADPGAFLPAFGGHDPVSVAAGFLTSGDPECFLIQAGSVFFFRTPAARQAFAETPDLLATATQRWPEVFRQNAFH